LKENSRDISVGVVISLLAELPMNWGYNSARDTEMFTFDIPARAHTLSYLVAARGYIFRTRGGQRLKIITHHHLVQTLRIHVL